MSSNVTSPSKKNESDGTSSPAGLKGKTKVKDNAKEGAHHDRDDDDDDDEDEDEDEDMGSGDDDDEEEEDHFEEIDPSVIKPRRTRGIRVDYTSQEALEKAGLEGLESKEEEPEDDDDDAMKD